MKLDIIIVDFALVAAVFVPYILFILIGKKEERKLARKFSEEVKKHQLKLSDKDRWNNNLLGFDSGKLKILFVQRKKSGIVAEVIDIRDIRSCEIYKEVQNISTGHRTEDILQKLGLQLKSYPGDTRFLELYNCEETYAQDYELIHAEKWNKKINALIVLRPTINSAA